MLVLQQHEKSRTYLVHKNQTHVVNMKKKNQPQKLVWLTLLINSLLAFSFLVSSTPVLLVCVATHLTCGSIQLELTISSSFFCIKEE